MTVMVLSRTNIHLLHSQNHDNFEKQKAEFEQCITKNLNEAYQKINTKEKKSVDVSQRFLCTVNSAIITT